MAKTAFLVKFQAKLCRPVEGGDWLFFRLPEEASLQLPTRSMVSVAATMNGYGFVATLQPDGESGHWLKVEPEWSEGANARAGDNIELEFSPVAIEPEPEVPDDLRAALSVTPAAMAGWTSITPIARRDWIQWLTTGKRADTRLIRMEKMMDMLSKGKRRICCFDRSGVTTKSRQYPIAADDASSKA